MASVTELLERATELNKIADDLEAPLQGKIDAFEEKQTEALNKFRAKQTAERKKFDDTIKAEQGKANEARKDAVKATKDALRAQGEHVTATPSRRRGSGTPSSNGSGDSRKRVPAEETRASILKFIKEHPGAKNGDIAEALSIKKSTLSQHLTAMVDAKAITREGERSTTTYTAA